jgi:hypothetical protein
MSRKKVTEMQVMITRDRLSCESSWIRESKTEFPTGKGQNRGFERIEKNCETNFLLIILYSGSQGKIHGKGRKWAPGRNGPFYVMKRGK